MFHEMIVSDKTASWKLFNRERKKPLKVEIKISEGFKGMHPSIYKCQILILHENDKFTGLVQIIKSLLMYFRHFPKNLSPTGQDVLC